MIDPKLWSQIQVTGITEADYERAVRHIDTINAMNNLTYNGIFIYDNFKMDHYHLTSNTFGRLGYKRSDVNNIGSIFIDAFITPEGQKAIWKATHTINNTSGAIVKMKKEASYYTAIMTTSPKTTGSCHVSNIRLWSLPLMAEYGCR